MIVSLHHTAAADPEFFVYHLRLTVRQKLSNRIFPDIPAHIRADDRCTLRHTISLQDRDPIGFKQIDHIRLEQTDILCHTKQRVIDTNDTAQ